MFDYTEQVPKTKMQTHSNSPAKTKIPNNKLNAQNFKTNDQWLKWVRDRKLEQEGYLLFAFAERFFEDVSVLLDLAYSDHVFLGFDFLSTRFFFLFY